jgi:acyl carrier protein|tara:strand:+ start:363 stop:611 length:249 start_codon:yes stop_codon:yes gene_type:complete
MSEKNNLEKLMLLLSRILDINIDNISDETSPDNTENWDSYNGLMMVSELESEFNVHFTMDEVVEVKNVGDIKAALIRHNIEL